MWAMIEKFRVNSVDMAKNGGARGERMQESADMARKIRAATAASGELGIIACKILAMGRPSANFPLWTSGLPNRIAHWV
jgi:hypothetical protein